jgi:hypothetical protein
MPHRSAASPAPGNKVLVQFLATIAFLALLGHLLPDLASTTTLAVAALVSALLAYLVPERVSQYPV